MTTATAAEPIKSLMQEFEAIYRQYRVDNHSDYNLDVAVMYRMSDLANEIKQAIKSGGESYAVEMMKEELIYFKEQISREKAA